MIKQTKNVIIKNILHHKILNALNKVGSDTTDGIRGAQRTMKFKIFLMNSRTGYHIKPKNHLINTHKVIREFKTRTFSNLM